MNLSSKRYTRSTEALNIPLLSAKQVLAGLGSSGGMEDRMNITYVNVGWDIIQLSRST